MTENRSRSEHIVARLKRTCKRLHILRRVKPYMNEIELLEIYCAFIRSIFDYCCSVYAHLFK